ncbi:unnamed protein product, partial [Staurois parvus]
MVRVTSQGSEQVASSVVQRVRQRDGQGHKPGIRTGSKQRGTEALVLQIKRLVSPTIAG